MFLVCVVGFVRLKKRTTTKHLQTSTKLNTVKHLIYIYIYMCKDVLKHVSKGEYLIKQAPQSEMCPPLLN